jgi:hypothetical protein
MLNWLVEEKGIAPHIPVFDKSKRDDGTFSRSDFRYDPASNVYHCPAGKTLTTTGTLVNDGTTLLYLARKHDCDGCELKALCCAKSPFRKIPRDRHEAARDVARALARSIMLAMPKHGTKLPSTATLRRRIVCFGTRTRAVYLPWLRSIAISQASRPNLKWSEQRVERSMRCLSNNKPSLCFGLDVIGSSHARLIWCTVDVPRSAIRVKIGSAPCKPMSAIGESADFALTESDVGSWAFLGRCPMSH